jgi:hypothetical protein
LKNCSFQADQKCPDARRPRRFSPGGEAGNPEENQDRVIAFRKITISNGIRLEFEISAPQKEDPEFTGAF